VTGTFDTALALVGDIGGTNCRLALFRGSEKLFERTYPSQEQKDFVSVVERFLEDARKALGSEAARPQRSCFGVAGPVENQTSKPTNLPWFIDGPRLAQRLKIPRVFLLNDFQAAALGVTVLGDGDLIALGGGPRNPTGPCVVAGAGTGLGEAFLVWSPGENRYQVIPSEGGHVDFTPRTALESGLFHYLSGRYGRVSFERVLSGPGIADTFSFLSAEPACRPLVRPETMAAIVTEDPATVVTRQALAGADPVCVIALNIFVSVLGGLAGNLALTMLASGGVFIAGGIAPRIAPMIQNGPFRESFESKGRMQKLVAKVPAFLVINPDLGLLGAMVQAQRL
jgi:glucokinase